MLYPVISQLEFHRHPEYEPESSDIELHLLAQMPKDDLVWYCNLLATMGDLLIATGNRLKDNAHPSATILQETL